MSTVRRGRPVEARIITNEDQRIGLTLRTFRIDRGLTGADMAEALSISPGMYDHYEAGRRHMPYSRIQRAAWFLTYKGTHEIQPEAIACRPVLEAVAA